MNDVSLTDFLKTFARSAPVFFTLMLSVLEPGRMTVPKAIESGLKASKTGLPTVKVPSVANADPAYPLSIDWTDQ